MDMYGQRHKTKKAVTESVKKEIAQSLLARELRFNGMNAACDQCSVAASGFLTKFTDLCVPKFSAPALRAVFEAKSSAIMEYAALQEWADKTFPAAELAFLVRSSASNE